MPTKTITLKVPSNIPKKKIIEAIKRLELEEKYKKTDNFKLFVKDEDLKIKIYKIAEFVENYLKKHYPKVKFKLSLEYDDSDNEISISVIFKSKISAKDAISIIDKVNEAVRKSFSKDERKWIYITLF